ncbi:BglG family transcription antiterminator [Paenibacillus ginsengihumi]|uniref:BglG family transcription antiterminator n=1 Tax=Paenibacillus ginsengihumi TaxID=431596 RepID=UPI000375D93D|nr:BglG family transcription antiterminator [Paenibacillus ginsengihumi]
MNISNRQRHMLELLLSSKEEITASEVASEINVSTRTVHRELAELEPVLAAFGVSLVKKSGVGIQLQGKPRQLDELKQSLLRMHQVDYTAEERKVLMLCTLLEADEPIKLFSLAYDLQVTVPTVSHDLDELEHLLKKHGLALIRRRGFGVMIRGSEENKRRMIGTLVMHHLDDSVLFGKTLSQTLPPVTKRLLDLIGKDNLMEVEQALWHLEEKQPSDLSEEAYTELLIRLSVAIRRMRQGKRVEAPEGTNPSGRFGSEEPETQRMVRELTDMLGMPFPPEEAGYVAGLLGGRRGLRSEAPEEDLSALEMAIRLIAYMEERTGIPFSEDRILREGLVNHLQPAVQRLLEGMPIRNPLLAQIKKDYEQLFSQIRQGADRVMTGLAVPDEEIGYLVMHFGAAMERLKQFSRNVKAIIVCTSGIGSSRMLAARLEKELPQVKILGHASWYEAVRIPRAAYDLIISTVDLPLEPDQYIKLSPLLTAEETERLRAFIRKTALQRQRPPQPQESEAALPIKDEVARLREFKSYLDEIVSLIEQFRLFRLPPPARGRELRDTLRKASEAALPDASPEAVEAIVSQLIERERHGTQVIPDTRLALFHTRSEHIARPVLSLFRLKQPLTLEPQQPGQVSQILLMLAPLRLADASLEVLSEVSGLLLVQEMIALLEEGTDKEIRHFLAGALLDFYQSKLDTRRDAE